VEYASMGFALFFSCRVLFDDSNEYIYSYNVSRWLTTFYVFQFCTRPTVTWY
jgi:hypothetical protein